MLIHHVIWLRKCKDGKLNKEYVINFRFFSKSFHSNCSFTFKDVIDLIINFNMSKTTPRILQRGNFVQIFKSYIIRTHFTNKKKLLQFQKKVIHCSFNVHYIFFNLCGP
jgi:hypothetical protein